jgi:predicted transcriptional regulator
MVISFEELRKLKDSLPDGTIHQIAEELNISVETVRNYFGGYNFRNGEPTGEHFEKGYQGGFVEIQNSQILETAQKLAKQNGKTTQVV